MRLTKEQILEKIKQLPPLLEYVFEAPQLVLKPVTSPTKISNEEILDKLDEVYASEKKDLKQTDEKFNSSVGIVEEEYSCLYETNNDDSQDQNQSIHSSEESQKTSESELRQSYFLTPVKNLKFNESQTFFSPQFENLLKEMLEGKEHSKLSKIEINELNTALQDLSTVEFEWKEYHRRSITKEIAHEQFNSEYAEFSAIFEGIRFPKDDALEGQRAETKFMAYKIGFITHSLIQFLYVTLNFKVLDFCSEYTADHLGTIVVSHIDPKRIFNDLARISIKKAHEKLLALQEEPYKDDVLSVSRFELFEEFRKTFIVEIFYAILTYGETSRKIKSTVAESLSREVQVRVFYKNLLLILESKYPQQFLQFSDLTQSILQAFISSNFFTKSITKTVKKNKASVQLILPDHIIVQAYRPLKFPNIVRPAALKKKDIDKLIKPLINGQGSLTKSDRLVTALNISRHKPHKVNRLFLALSKEFFPKLAYRASGYTTFESWLLEGDIDVGTDHTETIQYLRLASETLKRKLNSAVLSLYIANCVMNQLSISHNIALNSFSSLIVPCGITRVESIRFYTAKVLENDYVSKLIDSQYTQSRIFLASQLKEFPLYITDILCIRLRMYPREHWLSRTAGSMKHLLQNFKAEKLTQQGFISLLEAYYTANPEQLVKFKNYLSGTSQIEIKKNKKVLVEYFSKNPLDFTKIKKPMYFLNLHLAILEAIDNNLYTSVNVEIDQNASALSILSFVLQSKEMASVCNLLGGEAKSSPYDHIKEKCAEFLETKEAKPLLDNPEYSDVCNFLRSSRNLHKYAIMCFCYNQTTMGRMENFSEEWRKEFGFLPNATQSKGLTKFASIYPDFVEFVFPKTKLKLDIFKSIVDLVCEEAPHLQMKTIDGEVINWAFYATTYKNRKYYDTVERTHKSFKMSVFKLRKNKSITEHISDDFPQNFELDAAGMKRRFLSYFIHSIDASILRQIIYQMKKKHNVSVNHLHDCIILHPNHVTTFYTIVQEIYTSPELYNIVFDGFFNPVANTLSPESLEELNSYKAEFLKSTKGFQDQLNNMNPYDMYSFEN